MLSLGICGKGANRAGLCDLFGQEGHLRSLGELLKVMWGGERGRGKGRPIDPIWPTGHSWEPEEGAEFPLWPARTRGTVAAVAHCGRWVGRLVTQCTAHCGSGSWLPAAAVPRLCRHSTTR